MAYCFYIASRIPPLLVRNFGKVWLSAWTVSSFKATRKHTLIGEHRWPRRGSRRVARGSPRRGSGPGSGSFVRARKPGKRAG